MATTPTTPTTPATPATPTTPAGTATPAPVTAPPPPKPPTPLDPPAVYYNQKWRVPPLMVDTQEQADALDPAEWTTGAPPKAPASAAAKPADQYPQLYANVNLPPKIVGSKADAAALGDEWKQFDLPDALCKAAEAQNAAKAQAAAAKDQTQTQGQGQSAAQNAPTQQTQSQGQTAPQTPPQQTWNPQTGWSG